MSLDKRTNERIYWFKHSESTMDDGKRILPGKNWFFISSETQNRGRGTHGRRWENAKGNGFLTIGVRKGIISRLRSTLLPLETSIVLYRTISGLIGSKILPSIRIKWPNDILIEDKKAAGILIEQTESYYLIGMGINISSAPVLPDGEREACCLNQFGKIIDRKELLIMIFQNVKNRLSSDISPDDIRTEWKQCVAWNSYERIRRCPEEKIKPLDINNKGQLLVQYPNGTKDWLTAEYLV